MAYYQPQYQSGYQPQYQPQHQPQYQQGYATSPNPSYGQQQLTPRTLHIYHEGLTHRRAHILDSDKRTPLYRIEEHTGGLFSSKPQVKIQAAATNAEIGTVKFHSISSDIDMTIHNRPIKLGKAGLMTSAHEFTSLATGGSFKWKRDGTFTSDMICLDQSGQAAARFQSSGWAMKKEGKFELMPGVQGALMDEIVTSGIAMVEYKRRQQASSAGSGGGVSC